MIKLWENTPPGFDPCISSMVPSITHYASDIPSPHPAVLVCPGGGYSCKAPHEGEPIAQWLNSIGISAFVLDYRVAPYRHPYPLMDAKRALRLIRYNASKWNINPEKVGIIGFSAGGHLASAAATMFDEGDKNSEDPVERMSSRPDAMILCYPVISMGEYENKGSTDCLLGENAPDNLRHSLSTQNSVSENTPPAFLWHTSDDDIVNVQNSILFAQALNKYKVPFSMHIFPHGEHGLAITGKVPEVAVWTDLCQNWLASIGFTDTGRHRDGSLV